MTLHICWATNKLLLSMPVINTFLASFPALQSDYGPLLLEGGLHEFLFINPPHPPVFQNHRWVGGQWECERLIYSRRFKLQWKERLKKPAKGFVVCSAGGFLSLIRHDWIQYLSLSGQSKEGQLASIFAVSSFNSSFFLIVTRKNSWVCMCCILV